DPQLCARALPDDQGSPHQGRHRRCGPGSGRRSGTVDTRLPGLPQDRQNRRSRQRRYARRMTVAEAALKLRVGELVAFPTETVYGLGASALDAHAVARIYELKGRPRTTPLIVHVASVEMAREVVAEWPALAEE